MHNDVPSGQEVSQRSFLVLCDAHRHLLPTCEIFISSRMVSMFTTLAKPGISSSLKESQRYLVKTGRIAVLFNKSKANI